MKHIKLFESWLSNLKFWKINTTEPYFSESLKMIGMDEHNINVFLKNDQIQKHSQIYVGLDRGKEYQGNIWGWCLIKDKYWYMKRNFEYMGEIEEHEIDAIKYNL